MKILATIAIAAATVLGITDLKQNRELAQIRSNVDQTYAQSQEDLERHEEVLGSIIDCMRNNAYNRRLLGQCLDDWFDSNATVDY